jgi:hypothetical protein
MAKKYTGTITGVQGDKIKLNYDGYDFETLAYQWPVYFSK